MKQYDAIIIGAGAIGLSTAYFMKKAGLDILVIDKDFQANGCSYGNAGMIVPSHFVPLAAPGVVSKGIKWMFNPQSPFSILPTVRFSRLKWLMLFATHANLRNVDKHKELLYNLSIESRELYEKISGDLGFSFENKGLMMLFNTKKGEKEELYLSKQAKELGLDTEEFDQGSIQKKEPSLNLNVKGGVLYKTDANINPGEFMQRVKDFIGDENLKQAHIKKIIVNQKKVKGVETDHRTYECANLVITAGVWSKQIVKDLGISLPLEAGKGYSFTVPMHKKLITPSILSEAKVAITPFEESIRFSGTMQIGAKQGKVSWGKVKGILNSINNYIPDYNLIKTENIKLWEGLRPLSPDGIPYIGRFNQFENLYTGTGHAMMGISLAPVTGQIITNQLLGRKSKFDMQLLFPGRFN